MRTLLLAALVLTGTVLVVGLTVFAAAALGLLAVVVSAL